MTFETDNMPAFVVTIIVTVLLGVPACGIVFAPVFAIVRGVHDKWRWNVSWWKRPVLALGQWAVCLGLVLIEVIISLFYHLGSAIPIPIIEVIVAVTSAICWLVIVYAEFSMIFKMLETAYFLRTKRLAVWWKLATRKKSDEIPLEPTAL